MGFRLKSTLVTVGACLAMFGPAHRALAATKWFESSIDLTVVLDGHQTFLALSTGLSPTLLSNEVLADGARHAQFELPIGRGAWQLDESVVFTVPELITDPYYLPHVDTYLTPLGASYLTFSWTLPVACHGGCGIIYDLFFRLDSPTSSLFEAGVSEPTLPNINTAAFNSGEGYEAWTWVSIYPDVPSSTGLSRFSVVPEPDVGLLILAGGVVSLAGSPRRSRAGTA